MYITRTPSKRASGKTYYCTLLRESYREGGKIKNRTIANLSNCSENEIAAIKLALAHKDNPKALEGAPLKLVAGRKIGAAYVLSELTKRLGIAEAVGDSFQGKLALFQTIVRVLEQGSRLSATRVAQSHDIVSVIGLKRGFDENDLYTNLQWLSERQSKIEDVLFKKRGGRPSLFLYDVTSSYFEGTENELANYGYNRDGKKRRKQIVVGLLCNQEGNPVSVQVFEGNTQDVETFIFQVHKVIERFDCSNVTFVGDRGMIKNAQIEEVEKHHCQYVTALTMPQFEKLLKDGTLNLESFVPELNEVILENVRYVFRKNPARAAETMATRMERLAKAEEKVKSQNEHLANSSKAKLRSAKKDIQKWLKKLFLDEWVKLENDRRHLRLEIDEGALAEKSRLDGCYVYKTNLCAKEYSPQTVFERYKDLALVEWAFRTCKTTHLDLRPIYVRTADNTRGHVFIVMLAYMLVKELSQAWKEINLTVEEGLDALACISRTDAHLPNGQTIAYILSPDEISKRLLDELRIKPPASIEESPARVVSRCKVRESANI